MKLNNLGIVIQARTGSKRLPNKLFYKIGNKTILEHIFYSLKKAKLLKNTIVATTNLNQDKKIVNFCKKKKLKYFCGNKNNVLDRYYKCSLKFKFNDIVRLTADNPFANIDSIKKLANFHIMNKFDYSTTLPVLPIGTGIEIFSKSALKKSFINAKSKYQKEHVNEYILQNKKKFRIGIFNSPCQYNKKFSYTIDTMQDYIKILKNFKKYRFNFKKYS